MNQAQIHLTQCAVPQSQHGQFFTYRMTYIAELILIALIVITWRQKLMTTRILVNIVFLLTHYSCSNNYKNRLR